MSAVAWTGSRVPPAGGSVPGWAMRLPSCHPVRAEPLPAFNLPALQCTCPASARRACRPSTLTGASPPTSAPPAELGSAGMPAPAVAHVPTVNQRPFP